MRDSSQCHNVEAPSVVEIPSVSTMLMEGLIGTTVGANCALLAPQVGANCELLALTLASTVTS